MAGSRIATGGRIDRSVKLTLSFDGRKLSAHPGDTLASALMADGQLVVARGFKYHRPRGIYSAGVEEPNALVQLHTGAKSEPNARATTVEAIDGLSATGQNAWPNVRFDFGAMNQLFGPFLFAGFYYKTFIGPFRGTSFWMFCEKFIRKAAGMGRATKLADPDTYEKVNGFCDVLVIGGGPAGISAALAAGRSGAKVMLVEQDMALGGSLLSAPLVDQQEAWLEGALNELQNMNNVQILTRSTVFGAYDQDVYGVVERIGDHGQVPVLSGQRYWQIRTKQAVMATGAIERPLVFGGNDKPGVMLAGAARTYVNRYGVRPGRNIVVATNNDSAYSSALDLARAGAKVTLLDARLNVPDSLLKPLDAAGIKTFQGYGVIAAKGRKQVSAAIISATDENGVATGNAETVSCDIIAISGGWSPVVHLWSQRQQKPIYNESKACFIPEEGRLETMKCAGSAIAVGDLELTISQGFLQGTAAALDAGIKGEFGELPPSPTTPFADDWAREIHPVWLFTKANGKTHGKAFIDLQHDVLHTDIALAHREGYVSVEHLKRYTTTGMATDQGKLSNMNALAGMAELQKKTIPQVGTTTFRPPFTPVTIGAIVGHGHGRHFQPTRKSPIHDWHETNGAAMNEAGAWMRPRYYPIGKELLNDAYVREAAHVRKSVGMVDVSTLGKIAVQGPDASEFLNRIYVNGWKTLQVGRIRYGIMLREDGLVMDDGATARIAEFDYFMTTTTANAAKVLASCEHLLQTAWKDLRVHVTSITDQWAAIAVAGPNSRDLLIASIQDVDLSSEALPNNHFTHAKIDGIAVRIHRMSYSGELAFEVYIPSGFGKKVWESLIKFGEKFNVQPYGTEAMGALRIEKGHVAGPELDGRTTLNDFGMDRFASRKKPFIGSVLRNRSLLVDASRPTLVGLEFDGSSGTLPGALIFEASGPTVGHGEGWVSSTTYSPALGKNIALAFLKNGPARMGDTMRAVDFVGGTSLSAKIVSHHFFDPEGERQNA
ncbi:MAG: sarcosine oxidase subunit alpha family protein [Rhizobiaceae bacterium]